LLGNQTKHTMTGNAGYVSPDGRQLAVRLDNGRVELLDISRP